jgi:hypothetical protein
VEICSCQERGKDYPALGKYSRQVSTPMIQTPQEMEIKKKKPKEFPSPGGRGFTLLDSKF